MIASKDEKLIRRKYSINADTYTFTGKTVGIGCWGRVDLYKDAGGQMWAIKNFEPNAIARKQMQERNWTEEDVMRNESLPLNSAYRHVVPRRVERDKNGKMFVAMPYYEEGDLSERMSNLNLKESLKITRDIADATAYAHEQMDKNGRKVAHGDIKPSNIMIENGRAFLNDWGSRASVSIGGTGSNRGAHGDANYQAPESRSSGKNARVSIREDVWSIGSVLYEMLSGQGIYDGLDRENDKQLQKGIKGKLRKLNTPRKVKGFLENCLAVDEHDRYKDGRQTLDELEKTIEDLDTRKSILNHIKKWTLPLGAPLVLAGLLTYAGANIEPKELSLPNPQIHGPIYLAGENQETIKLNLEEITGLPNVDPSLRISEESVKRASNNRNVACLLKSHMQAIKRLGIIRSKGINEYQAKTYMAYTSLDDRRIPGAPHPIFGVPAKSIEVALSKSRLPNGEIDLEDTLAIARLGETKVNQAKRAVDSFDFKDYINAKDASGKDIIPNKEKRFLMSWLAYTHELIK